MQMRNTVKILKLPSLQGLPLCPVKALKNLLLITPGNQDTPLFQIKNHKAQWVPLLTLEPGVTFIRFCRDWDSKILTFLFTPSGVQVPP